MTAFINGEVLTSDEGQPLIDEAQFIIDLLEEFGIDAFGDPILLTHDPIPSDYYLSQASPNPFNSSTRLSFGLPEATHVTIGVYDMSGRLVARLVDAELEAGHHMAVWDAVSVPDGVYLVRMEATDFNVVRKAVLMR